MIPTFENFNINESNNFPDKYEGNDGIIWVKKKETPNIVNYEPYYRGYNISVGGYNFKTYKEFIDFVKNYILSNSLYNKYRFKDPIPLK